MRISAEQLARLLIEISERYSSGPWDLSSPGTVWALIQRDYPEVTGVEPPPSEAEVRHRYLSDFWRTYSPPSAFPPPVDTIGPESRESREYNARLRREGFDPANPNAYVVDGLDLLRGNPMGALCFLVGVARGREPRDAMRWARVAGAIWDLAGNIVGEADGPSTASASTEDRHGTEVGPPPPYEDSEIRSRLDRLAQDHH